VNGLLRFLGKELVEIARTWRLPVVGGVVLVFALTGPVLALLTPQLLESIQSGQSGVIIQVPEPMWRDAYAQWVKNLSQIVAFVAIIVAAGSVAGEVASGTAALVVTKPVSRSAFVVAKALSLFVLIASTVLAGAAVTQLVTLLVFGEAPAAELWLPTIVWLVFAALLISIATFLSTLVSTLAAAGIGVGVFFAVSLTALWGPAVRYSPAGLVGAPAELLAGRELGLAWPLVTAVVASIVLVWLGAWAFSRREL
jgi:ABC-2 type transport system permease protein